MKVDYIIVGLGLAGLAFAEELIKNNKTFIVFEDSSQHSSSVASGTYNPVILKRFTAVWNGHRQLQLALPFYEKIFKKIDKNLDVKFTARKVFNSIGDENNWFTALDKPTLSNYMQPEIIKEKIKGVVGEFGFGELKGIGKIDTKELIKRYRSYLSSNNKLKKEQFEYNKIDFLEGSVKYKEILADRVVFCEGYGLKQNPFFNQLPLRGTKGETITIHAPQLKIDFLLKSSIFVIPLGDDFYKVGATFNREDKTSKITKEGRQELIDKLQKTITVPYIITEQNAGVRPTVKDRRPLVGIHSKYSQLCILNGLGTRGIMIAPTVALNLFNHLEKGEALDKEIDIKRFD